MTGEQFRTEYHLLDRVSSGAVETYHAQAATGTMIMVHFLRGSAQENAAILTQLHRLEPTRAARILRTLEVDGVTTVVTRFILDFVTFAEWIREGLLPESATPAGAPAVPPPAPAAVTPPPPAAVTPPPPDPVPPPAPPVRDAAATPDAVEEAVQEPAAVQPEPEPGEFTRMFKAVRPLDDEPAAPASSHPDSAPAAQPPPPAGAAPPAESAGAAAVDSPGEFTLMFRAPGTPSGEPARPVPPPAPRPTAPEPSVPRPPDPERPAQTSQPHAPGHGTITPAARNAGPASTDWLASLQAESGSAPSDFERDDAEEPGAPASGSPTGPHDASAAGSPPASGAPVGGSRPPAPPRADAWPPAAPPPPAPGSSPPAPAAPPPAPAGPGDFTQMFGAAARPSDQAPPPAPPPPASPRPASQPPASAPPSYAGGFSFGDAGTPKPPFRPQSAPPPEPGGYTRMFGRPKLPAPGPPPAVPPPQGGPGSGQMDAAGTGGSYFDRLAGGAPQARPAVPPPVMPPPPAPDSSGPSEFTRVISAGQLPGTPPAPGPPPSFRAPPAPARHMSDRTLVLALIGVLVAAVIFVVVVALI